MRFPKKQVGTLLAAASLLVLGVTPGRGQESSASMPGDTITAVLTVHKFRKVDGPARLDALESLLPQVLKARLFGYHWLSILDAEVSSTVPGSSLPSPATSIKSVRGFDLEGTFVALEDKIRVDVSLKNALDNSLEFRGFEVFDEDSILDDADRLGQRIADALAAKSVSKPSDRRIVVGIGDFVNQPGSVSYTSLGALLSFSLLAQLSGAQLKNVSFRRMGGSAQADLGSNPPKMIVTGEYELVEDAIRASARIEEAGGAHFRVEAKGPPDGIPQVNQQLSKGVLEIIQGRITPDGKFRQAMVSLIDAKPEQYISAARKYEQEQDLFAAIVMYRKALETKPDDVNARYGLAGVYMAQADYTAAATEYQNVLQHNGKDVAVLLGVGNAYLKGGEAAKAIQAIQQAQSVGTDDPGLKVKILQTLGDAEMLAGAYDSAIQQYLRALQLPGGADSSELYHAVGRAYRTAGKLPQAIEYLNRARERFPNEAEFASDLASVYVAQGMRDYEARKYDEALTEYQMALDLRPTDRTVEAEAYGYSGAIVGYFRAKPDLTKGIDLASKSVELDPDKEWNRRFLAALYTEDGKYLEAIESLKKAIAIEPTRNSYSEMARAYRLMKNYPAAIESVQQALKLSPDYASGYEELGQTYQEQKDYPRAIENLQKAAQLSGTADAYVEVANAYLDNHDYQNALDTIRQALKIDKRSMSAYEALDEIYVAKGEPAVFLDTLSKAVAADPSFAWGHAKLGDLYRSKRQYDQAIENLERAVEIDGKQRWPREVLAQTYTEKKDYDKAQRALEQSLAISPTEWAYTQLALIYLRRDDYSKAIDLLQQALQLNDREAYVYETFEDVYKKMKQPQAFLALLEHAQKAHPDFDWAYRKQGEVYEGQGDYKNAIESLQKALSIKPDNKDSTHDLAETYRKQGEKNKDEGAPDSAMESFQKSLELEPSERAFEGLLDLYRSRKDWVDEIAVAEKFRAARPGSQVSYIYLAQAHIDEKDYAKALNVVKRGLDAMPKSAPLLSERGWIHQLQKEYPAAIEDCQTAIKADPKYYYPYWLLARIQLEQHEYEKAEVNARKVIELGKPEGYYELREALMGLKKYHEAIEALNGAVQKYPNDATILTNLAWVYHEGLYDDPSGYEQAYQINKQAYQADAKNPLIRANLAEASLTAGHYDEALTLANGVLTDPVLLPQDKLGVKVVTIAALLCQRKDANAFSELSEFIRYYESIKEDYERSWVFQGTRNFVVKHKTLSASERNLLLTLIGILESPKDQADKDLRDLKATLPALFQEFQKPS